MAKVSKKDVLSYLENANMLEISDLINDIEEYSHFEPFIN